MKQFLRILMFIIIVAAVVATSIFLVNQTKLYQGENNDSISGDENLSGDISGDIDLSGDELNQLSGDAILSGDITSSGDVDSTKSGDLSGDNEAVSNAIEDDEKSNPQDNGNVESEDNVSEPDDEVKNEVSGDNTENIINPNSEIA